MTLFNFQAAVYFVPKPNPTELLDRVRAIVPILNQELDINAQPIDQMNAQVLQGDMDLFERNGKQVFLLYREKPLFYGTNEWSLLISFMDDYSEATALHMTPELPELTRELTNFVWNRLLSILKVVSLNMKPLIGQINGLDEEEGHQIISAKTLSSKRLPDFFTPYTYLDKSLMDVKTANSLREAGAYLVEELGAGWSIQFVPDLYTQPTVPLERTLRRLIPDSDGPYKQTSVSID